jgi:hypothetical protein
MLSACNISLVEISKLVVLLYMRCMNEIKLLQTLVLEIYKEDELVYINLLIALTKADKDSAT